MLFALFWQSSSVIGLVVSIKDYVMPAMKVLTFLASIGCVLFIIIAGYMYMTSSGKPQQLDQAKSILRRALLGMTIVLAAISLASILTNAYGLPDTAPRANLPSLEAMPTPTPANGLVEVLIKATTGFIGSIIQTLASPFLAALNYFTNATPLMTDNPSVFNLWLAMVGVADGLLVLVIAMLGLQVMSGSSLGLDELDLKQLLPQVGLTFLLINSSIFVIDSLIELSNLLIGLVVQISGASKVWETLNAVVATAGVQSLAALLLMLAFLILVLVLLIYYVGRLVSLYIGVVLAPLIIGLGLLPGFRDFAQAAVKTYLATIFNLFVHVVILQLASSLLTGMAQADGDTQLPDTLMAMVLGLATLMALLKTQGLMTQLSYASFGARNLRQLGGQFINGVSYVTGHRSRPNYQTATSHYANGGISSSGSSSAGRPSLNSTSNGSARFANHQPTFVSVNAAPHPTPTNSITTLDSKVGRL